MSIFKEGNPYLNLFSQIEGEQGLFIPVEITIVQSGLKTQNLSTSQQNAFERVKILLSGADAFLKDVSSCKLTVLSS